MERLENNSEEQKFMRAKKRVKQLKDYYWHIAIYFIINISITLQKVTRNLNNGETFNEAFFDFSTIAVWWAWGIGLLIHTFSVFGSGTFFGREWEERKIKELMNDNYKKETKYLNK